IMCFFDRSGVLGALPKKKSAGKERGRGVVHRVWILYVHLLPVFRQTCNLSTSPRVAFQLDPLAAPTYHPLQGSAMHEILNPILEWLSTEHGSSYRSGYGWMQVVVAATLVGGLFKTNELRSRKRSFKEKMCRELADGCLTAKVFTASGTATTAMLQKNDTRYVVAIYGSDISKVEIRQEFCSIDDVEEFLEKETILRLSDFTL